MNDGSVQALLYNSDDALLDELRQRGIEASKIYLGTLGYVTDVDAECVCEAINEIMADERGWAPIVWANLDPEIRTKFMLMAADSDTFNEKARLPSGWGYEDTVREILRGKR